MFRTACKRTRLRAVARPWAINTQLQHELRFPTVKSMTFPTELDAAGKPLGMSAHGRRRMLPSQQTNYAHGAQLPTQLVDEAQLSDHFYGASMTPQPTPAFSVTHHSSRPLTAQERSEEWNNIKSLYYGTGRKPTRSVCFS